MWGIEQYTGFGNQYKKFSKKHENEASAALSNLETYFQVLQATNNVQAANQQPFVHPEPEGMVAIDQRGAKVDRKQGKLKAVRLYVYAAVINQTVYLLGIGDKDSQKQDIETCRAKVRQIKRGR
jgi:hypothetical protein